MKKIVRLAFVFLLFTAFVFAGEAPPEVWTRVQSKNFELAGNASEQQIRAVAARLEQFREVFHQMFPALKLDSSVPTRIIVFKDAVSYAPFKPIKTDGTVDAQVVGAFQTGREINYITLSAASDSTETFQTIFHEYTHFIISNNIESSMIEPWLNEGLAEYYETFRMENDQKAILGAISPENLKLLRQEQLIPLEKIFNTDNYTLNNQGDHGRSVFYAEVWALMHYLQHGGRREQTRKFFDLLFAGKSSREAFETAFQIDAAALDKELQNYIKQQTFQTFNLTLPQKSAFDNDLEVSVLKESEAQTMLGDLLLHSNRSDEAAARLEKALALDENSASAHALYGIALARRGKFTEAEAHFEKAVRLGKSDYLAYYYYAYALSSEDVEAHGFIESYRTVKANKMRELLNKSIELNPNFAESYHLLAFINLVNDENLTEAVELMEKALALDAGNQRFLLDLANIYMSRTDYKTAEQIAEKIFASTADKDLRREAQAVMISARQIQETLRRIEEEKKRGAAAKEEYPKMSKEEGFLIAQNEALRKPQNGEQRILGYLTQVNCGTNDGTFIVRAKNASQKQIANEMLEFSAAEMQKVRMITFVSGLEGRQMGCGVKKPEIFAVVTYRPSNNFKAESSGEIVSIEFVSEDFRFLP